MANLETYQKVLMDSSDQYNKLHHIANALLFLIFAIKQDKDCSFYDKELQKKVLQLVAFFRAKYSVIPPSKPDGHNRESKIAEVPIFNNRIS